MPIKTYREIIAWQKAHSLALEVYRLTIQYPKYELFGLTSQIRRCAVSVPSNLAEGFKRQSKNDSLHFYNIAQGSLEELRYQLLLSKDLTYISEKDYSAADCDADEVGRLIYSWIKNHH